MELVTHKKFKNGRLMPWGKGTVVSGAKGTVYLCGNTATSADYDPAAKKGGGFAGDAAAQWREVLGNIKSDLEELGSGLDHLIRRPFSSKGHFPTAASSARLIFVSTCWTRFSPSIVRSIVATTIRRLRR